MFEYIYIVLRYFIWVYQIKRIRTYMKDDIFSELIFRHLSVLLVTLTITMSRQSRRFLMIIYLYCADIWDRVYVCVYVESRVTSARKDYSFVIFQSECSVSQKRKEQKEKIEFFCTHYFII